jgi:sulfatase modifying factor 1
MNGESCCSPANPESTASVPSAAAVLPFLRLNTGSTEGMVRLDGGTFLMGNERDYGFPDDGEGPVHAVTLSPYWIDATTVTNEQFNAFVNATGYKTESENFGWSFVFQGLLTLKQQTVAAQARAQGTEWWCRVEGASWRHPEGPGTNIKKRWDHPAVHLSWHDAHAYAHWAGKRLATEAEWEFAARGGQSPKVPHRFPWGDELEPDGRHRMNVWQGKFPAQNTQADGHYGTAPARSYRANGYGLYQTTGNVWEWGWDYFATDTYARSASVDPTGPETPTDRRIMRGGSFLCHHSYCNRYRVDARSSNTPDSASSNIGFRCVRDV